MLIRFGDVDAKTDYRLVDRPLRGDTTTVVRAVSDGGGAGLGQEMRLDPRQYLILTRQWTVSPVLERGNAREQDSDDDPARIYATSDYDPTDPGLFDQATYEALQILGTTRSQLVRSTTSGPAGSRKAPLHPPYTV